MIARTWMKPLERIADAESVPADPQADVLRLFGDHGSALFRFCRSTLRNSQEAEDIVQDTFLKLLQHLQSGGDRSNLRSWLFTVAANACRDRLGWRARWLPWTEGRDLRTADPPEDNDEPDRARAALRSLPPRDRLLLSLRAQGLSYREMAAAAGIREASVGRLLARAVDRWRKSCVV